MDFSYHSEAEGKYFHVLSRVPFIFSLPYFYCIIFHAHLLGQNKLYERLSSIVYQKRHKV